MDWRPDHGYSLDQSSEFPVLIGLGLVQSQSFSSLEIGPSNTIPQRSISMIKTWNSVSTAVVKTMMLNHALTCLKLPRNASQASRLILWEKPNQKSWWCPWAFSWWWVTSFFLAFMGAKAQIHLHYRWINYTPLSMESRTVKPRNQLPNTLLPLMLMLLIIDKLCHAYQDLEELFWYF